MKKIEYSYFGWKTESLAKIGPSSHGHTIAVYGDKHALYTIIPPLSQGKFGTDAEALVFRHYKGSNRFRRYHSQTLS